MGNNDLIGSAEAAELLGLSGSSFNRRVIAGLIPPVQKLPGSKGAYIFHRADIEALKEAKSA